MLPAPAEGADDRHPDLDGPMPDGWDPRDWTVAVCRHQGVSYEDIAVRLNTSVGNVSRRVSKMRGYYGTDFLRVGHARTRKPATRARPEAVAQRWDDLRKLAAGKFGDASLKAQEIIDHVLNRYLSDPELLNSLSLADAKILASLAKDLGDRADKMTGNLPHERPDTGPSDIFQNIDNSVSDSRTRVTMQKIELIIEQFSAGDRALLPPPPDPDLVSEDLIELAEVVGEG